MQTSILSVRLSERERSLIESAAEETKTTVSDFARRLLVEAAETTLADRTVVTIPADRWAEFEAWAARPTEDVPALRRLFADKAPWER
jgi:uncharacterized protein (DUF1778 family)